MQERLGHSVKPPVIRERIVQLFGNRSRVELFARQKIEGWDAIGYGIDGISVQDKIKLVSNPDYKFSIVEGTEKEISVSQPQQTTLMFA
jgi:N6-adenosine-specific RNA methylase IME4